VLHTLCWYSKALQSPQAAPHCLAHCNRHWQESCSTAQATRYVPRSIPTALLKLLCRGVLLWFLRQQVLPAAAALCYAVLCCVLMCCWSHLEEVAHHHGV